jgi:uncharacterized membrane protein
MRKAKALFEGATIVTMALLVFWTSGLANTFLAIPLALGQNTAAAAAQENAVGSFTILDFPGAGVKATTALGINDDGEIVGRYDDAQGVRHGFLRSEDGFTTINFPGAVVTVAAGINDGGTVAGTYVSTDRVRHAFQLRDGQFLSLDPPASLTLSGSPVGINNRGTIVGSYIGQDRHVHCFAFRKGEFTTIDAPNGADTFCNAVNDKGEIVGGYSTGVTPNSAVTSVEATSSQRLIGPKPSWSPRSASTTRGW